MHQAEKLPLVNTCGSLAGAWAIPGTHCYMESLYKQFIHSYENLYYYMIQSMKLLFITQ